MPEPSPAPDPPGVPVPPARPPHPRVVAEIFRNLAQLETDPAAPEARAAVHAGIQVHGLAAFFTAALQRLTGEPVVATAVAAASVPVAAPLVLVPAPLVLVPAAVEEPIGWLRHTWVDCIG